MRVADIEYSRDDAGIATILLNRPARKNAFTADMLDRWADALRSAQASPEVRTVVLRGAGGAFCAGVDLDDMAHLSREPMAQKRFLVEHVQQIARAVDSLDKPLVACVSGPAVGAGMDAALMCDMRFAGSSARFCESYLRLGLVPGAGGAYYLPRIVGVAKAMELFLGTEWVDAEEALRIGLVNRVYPDDELLEKTYEFASRLASAPPAVASILKRTILQSAEADLRTALDLVSSHMGVVRSTAESREALGALVERRPPHTGA